MPLLSAYQERKSKMQQFDYLGLTFEPYRNLTEDERTCFYESIQHSAFSPEGFCHEDFYAAATAADPENAVDLFYYEGEVVLPCSSYLASYQDPQRPAHCIREKYHSLSMSTMLQIIEDVGINGFFPTPDDLAAEMLSGVNWDEVESVLEPSAGKGDLANNIVSWYQSAMSSYRARLDLDCVEINPDLRAILKSRGYRVIHDDFLTLHTHKRYQLIVMNPPFAEGDRHLMKAMEMVQNGGQVVCLLNAQTLRNPNTNLRKLLLQTLEKQDAVVTYFDGAFSGAERKSDVEVAMVQVTFPPKAEKSDLYEHLKKTVAEEDQVQEPNALAPSDFIEGMIRQFEVEVRSGLEIIRLYNGLRPYILQNINSEARFSSPILTLNIGNDECTVNGYLVATREKYWRALLQKREFTDLLTKDLYTKYQEMVDQLKFYDFSKFNIHRVFTEMRSEVPAGLRETILKVFDRLSAQHAWYPECSGNIHYYNGWATNKAHKINKKVIIPSHGIFPDWEWSKDAFQVYEAHKHLEDIEKILNYLDGCMTAEVDLHFILERANHEGQTKKIHCKYFDVTFYKKGTTHIMFHDQRIVDALNIYAARNRNWLPPSYGKSHYQDMGPEEQKVIDEFQGEEAYDQVLAHPDIYLSGRIVLALPGWPIEQAG